MASSSLLLFSNRISHSSFASFYGLRIGITNLKSSCSRAPASSILRNRNYDATKIKEGGATLTTICNRNYNTSIIMQRKDPVYGWWIRSITIATLSFAWTSSINDFSSSSSKQYYSYSTTPAVAMALSSSSSSSSSINSKMMSGGGKTMSKVSESSPLASLVLDNSWPRMLSPETSENLKKSRNHEKLSENDDNRKKRPVFNGHYVLVEPTGIKDPELLVVSNDVAKNMLQLTEEQISSPDFVSWVSGNLVLEETWATPYALSIMGTRYTNNCPYGTGNGYGDGRAISIAELNGYELQLKGAGKTPFHRGADGRAVLRSSIREFLASEAMHYLGVQTTRALSLVKSNGDMVQRPWYSDDAVLQLPTMDDPRLADYSEEDRKQILRQLRTQKADPNVMIREPCAITCRVASSFMRIGHIDLMSRRAEAANHRNYEKTEKRYDTTTNEWKELEEIIWHACYREYREEAYDPFIEMKDIAGAASKFLELAAENIATMVVNWVRVGFAQGNFNADNCLVGGKTMDYGPFGFLEEYDPLFAKWTGSGQHFGFMNQPSAGLANYQVLVTSVFPVIAATRDVNEDEDKTVESINSIMAAAQVTFQQKLDEMFRMKMGLNADSDVGDDLWETLQPLMRKSRVDWTLFWRQLTYVARDHADMETSTMDDYEDVMKTLEGTGNSSPFYEELSPELRRQWLAWLEQWCISLDQSNLLKGAYDRMRKVNPKYVLREWMLVDAYTSADNEDMKPLHELYELIQRPYEEGSEQEIKEYYRRAPDRSLTTGGTAFMS